MVAPGDRGKKKAEQQIFTDLMTPADCRIQPGACNDISNDQNEQPGKDKPAIDIVQ